MSNTSSAQAAATTPRGRVHPGIVLLAAAGATFLAFLDTTVANLAFPALRDDFASSSLADLSWVLTSYGVLFAALLTPAGRLADVLGRRRLFAVSVIGFTVTSLLVAMSPTLPYLIAARALQGAAAAGMIPSALGLVLWHTPAERRTTAVGLWAGAGSMAAALGPSLGGLLVDTYSWRAVFLINVPIGIVLVALTLRRLPEDLPSGRQLPDPLGTFMIAIAVGLAVLALTEGSAWGWRSVSTVCCLTAALALLGLALYRSKHHAAPAVETDLWRRRIFAVTTLGSLLFGVSIFAWLLLGPLILSLAWQYTILEAGLAMSPGAVASAVAAVLVGRRASARGRHIVVVVGSLVLAGCALWFFQELHAQPQFLTLFLPVNIISGAAIGAVLTALSSAAAISLPSDRYAAGVGLVITARQLGGAIGIAALAAILTAKTSLLDGIVDVTLFCAIAAASTGFVGLGMSERRPVSTSTIHDAPGASQHEGATT